MTVLRAIGLMSGTSMDGIDVAALATDGETVVERGPSHFVPYDAAFRARIAAALDAAKRVERRNERPGDLAALEHDLTKRHAAAVEVFRADAGREWASADVIGFHGQTILHRPEKALTVQLGDGSLLARETGVEVVYDMRANDMVFGGQGAPLVPAYHAALAHALATAGSIGLPVVFVNIGGISNITFVSAHGDPIAFDTGPGNNLIDQWVFREGGKAFDEGGVIASEGRVSQAVVERYLSKPFFDAAGPKSLDRGDFSLDLAEGMSLADGARTLASLAAQAILKSVEHLPAPPKLWVICGGGGKNPHIVDDLRRGAKSHGADVLVARDLGLDGDAIESEAWAYLAVRSIKGLPLTFPTTTGCRKPITGGIHCRPDPTGLRKSLGR